MIETCLRSLTSSVENQVFYLTIQESTVEAGMTQRRPGIHTDSYSTEEIIWDEDQARRKEENDDLGDVAIRGKGTATLVTSSWGCGRGDDETMEGGIFIASSVKNSCAGADVLLLLCSFLLF